ncbi:diacylglycerol O-acyltransferase 1 [Apophysomyces sp. BC1034]|nr:diacylglycerol O-acyltransferase 1 [Apophysomyces sp. BC1034]
MSVDSPNVPHSKDKSKHVRAVMAPLNVPFQRRLQTLAVIFWGGEPSFAVSLFFLLCTIPLFWPLIIIYLIWMAFDNAPVNGGRRVEWVRRWKLWKYFADYFPAEIIKEADLDPTKNYIFGYHPHGIIAVGGILTFSTEALGFSELYPGIVPSLMTVPNNFRLPIHRDYLLAIGMCTVSRDSCKRVLQSEPGRSIAIVVGGVTESLNSRPGSMNLTIKKRLGFVKLAVETGSSLVPVLNFGENQLFNQLSNDTGTWVRRFQKQTQNIFVGEAIDPPADAAERDKEEVVRELHTQYMQSLQALYDKYKDVYAPDRVKDMEFVE